MGEKVVNNFSKPITLDNGTILAASGTDGSMREDVELSDRDRRRHVPHRIAILDEGEKSKSKPARTVTPAFISNGEVKS